MNEYYYVVVNSFGIFTKGMKLTYMGDGMYGTSLAVNGELQPINISEKLLKSYAYYFAKCGDTNLSIRMKVDINTVALKVYEINELGKIIKEQEFNDLTWNYAQFK